MFNLFPRRGSASVNAPPGGKKDGKRRSSVFAEPTVRMPVPHVRPSRAGDGGEHEAVGGATGRWSMPMPVPNDIPPPPDPPQWVVQMPVPQVESASTSAPEQISGNNPEIMDTTRWNEFMAPGEDERRPAPAPSCSKVKIRLALDSNVFLAGGLLHGRMQVTSYDDEELYLGEIAVYLNGFEFLHHRGIKMRQDFLKARMTFQGGNDLPPSNAVVETDEQERPESQYVEPASATGITGVADYSNFRFWRARKGKTTFPFAFKIPQDCPSCFTFKKLAKIDYLLTARVHLSYRGKMEILERTRSTNVFEAWQDYEDPRNYEPRSRGASRNMRFFQWKGSVEVNAKIHKGIFTSGSSVYVKVHVKNRSNKPVVGMTLSALRRLVVNFNDIGDEEASEGDDDDEEVIKDFTEVLGRKRYCSKDYTFDPGEERSTIVDLVLPAKLYSVRLTGLSRIVCAVRVSLHMGLLRRPLCVELPISVQHQGSISRPGSILLDTYLHPQHYNLNFYSLNLEDEIQEAQALEEVANDNAAAAAQRAGSDLRQTPHSPQQQRPKSASSAPQPWNNTSVGHQRRDARRSRIPSSAPRPYEVVLSEEQARDLETLRFVSRQKLQARKAVLRGPAPEPASPEQYVSAGDRKKVVERYQSWGSGAGRAQYHRYGTASAALPTAGHRHGQITENEENRRRRIPFPEVGHRRSATVGVLQGQTPYQQSQPQYQPRNGHERTNSYPETGPADHRWQQQQQLAGTDANSTSQQGTSLVQMGTWRSLQVVDPSQTRPNPLEAIDELEHLTTTMSADLSPPLLERPETQNIVTKPKPRPGLPLQWAGAPPAAAAVGGRDRGR